MTDVLQAMVQQQALMLQVQAESLRLQRTILEQLLGARAGEGPIAAADFPSPPILPTINIAAPIEPIGSPTAPETMPVEAQSEPAPALEKQSSRRAARYYEQRAAPTVKIVEDPADLELMRRLQEMRDAGDLILQFGPYKSMTLAQVAIHHPEYIRELMTRAQRPEVRAAAGRLVEALDAAAEHTRRIPRGAARRGRPSK